MTLAALGFAVACASTDSEPRSAAPIQDGSVQVLGEADSLLINDPLGSLLAETSGSGAVQARFATYPFGKTRFSTSAETELYTGAARDRGVELDLMGARSYAPDLGIWTIGDPIVVNSPESLVDSVFAVANPYAYAALTPLVAVDPDGNHPAWVVMAMGALAGASASSGIEVVSQLLENGRVTQPGRVYAAAAGGAAAGAFTGGVGGLVVGTTSKVALGSAAGVVQVATTEVVRTKGKSAGTPGQLAVGAATGGAMVGLSVTVMRGATAPKPSFSGCNQMFCWGENGGSVRKGAGDAVATGGGRGRNNLRPIPTAGGAHSTFKRNPATGELTGHAEWKPNPRNPNGFDQVKRVDTQHANPHTHHNKVTGQQVPTPHAHEKSAPGGVRPARPDELPK